MGNGRKVYPNRLRKYRRLANLSQREVARLLNHKSANRLSRWESGFSLPSLKNVLKLSTLYRTLVGELYRDLLTESQKELNQNIISSKKKEKL